MSITLQDYAAGDTNYVSKLNSNNDVLESAISALQAATSGAASPALSIATAYESLFGTSVALIGAGSFVPSAADADTLSVTSGYCYRPSLNAVLSKASSTTFEFAGQPADTYYLTIDTLGVPAVDTDADPEAIYSVVWSGAAFGAITRLANVVWGAADWIAAQDSAALSASYDTLDARLEAAEAAASASGGPYDVGGSYAGAPTASLVIVRYPFPRAVTFPSGLTDSKGVAATAATAQTDFDLKKNGVSFGTMRFAAAGTSATFIAASPASFATGDILTVVAPASPDATLASIGFALAGTR